MLVALRLSSTQITFQSALDIAAGVPFLLRAVGLKHDSHRAVRKLLREYIRKPSAVEAQDDSSADPSQESAVARLSQVQ